MALSNKQFSAFLDTIENRAPLAIQRPEPLPKGDLSDWNKRAHAGSIVRDITFDESTVDKTGTYT